MTISEYKYVIAHKDGKLHKDADALLHYPVSEHDETLDHTWAGHVNTVGVMTQDNREELTRGQQAEWAYVFRNAENGKETVNYTIENTFCIVCEEREKRKRPSNCGSAYQKTRRPQSYKPATTTLHPDTSERNAPTTELHNATTGMGSPEI